MQPDGDEVLEAGGEPEEEPVGADPEGLRAQQQHRLEEGASDEAILKELMQQVPASALAQRKTLLAWMPLGTAVKAIGGVNEARVERLLETFLKCAP